MKATIVKATLICGTLDILYAIIMAITGGGSALNVLHSVASGPFGASVKSWGWAGGLLGLGVHFTIMLVMVSFFVMLIKYVHSVASMNTVLLGAIYGAVLYLVMYWIVLTLRWPSVFPQTDPLLIIKALIPHIFLVGIPMSIIVKRASIQRSIEVTSL